MAEWFHAPELGPTGEYLLEGPEAQHLRGACRAKPGDRVTLFDGRGGTADAEVAQVERRAVWLRILEHRVVDRPTQTLTLAVALPKGDRARWLVEKATELGVTHILPLRTARSVTDPGGGKLDKLQRAAVEACKQSAQAWLPEIATPIALGELAARPEIRPAVASGTAYWLAPGGAPLPSAAPVGDAPLAFAVGPEGGWTDEELATAASTGWRVTALPTPILRIETAGLAILAWARLTHRDGG